MGALNRKLLRDLWRLRGQVLAVALIVGSGVAVLVMSILPLALEIVRIAAALPVPPNTDPATYTSKPVAPLARIPSASAP